MKTELRNFKKGDFFTLKESPTAPVWVKGEYDRTTKTYSCYKYEDVNHETFLKPNRVVYEAEWYDED